MRFTPLALMAGLLVGAGAALAASADAVPPAASAASSPVGAAVAASKVDPEAVPKAVQEGGPPGTAVLQPSAALGPLPRGDATALPSVLQARSILGQPDFLTHADGDAEFRRGGLVVHADHLIYDSVRDLATAQGQVRIYHDGAIYKGPEMQLEVQRFRGYFLDPEFEFPQLGSGGRADRVDFIDSDRSRALKAEYTSCVRQGSAEPDWLLRADSVQFDQATQEGVARGAVLDFLGVPILALPTLSFPLSDERKSGWLPPSVDTDNRSGIEVSVPYYWNIAPNRDATLTPRILTRRGFGLDGEFRYLEPGMKGVAAIDWLPSDRLTGTSREALQWNHDGQFGPGLLYSVDAVHVSDDAWWKDFPNASRSLTPRLLPMRASIERPFSYAGGQGLAYVHAEGWQVLQGSDATVVGPYQRSPQIGVRLGGDAGVWHYEVQTEYNRFTLPAGDAARDGREGGARWSVLADLSRPWRAPGWFLVPKLSVNGATYAGPGLLPGGDRSSRTIPSFSLDGGLEFERETTVFGRSFHQTLEPRMLYVITPYRPQSQLPNYDASAKDFNFSSVYSVNQFSGVDRVSDGRLLTAGFTTRFVDTTSGAEALRLGLVQRYLLSEQRETAQTDGTPDGPPTSEHLSDVLLLGSTNLIPHWSLNSTLDYSPVIRRSVSSVVGANYSPGPFRTLNASYRYTRGLSDQIQLGWQWPLWSRQSAAITPAAHSAGGGGQRCGGTLYTVGSLSYSRPDSRITDSVLGLEYDAGCWIARVVAERLSTGSSEATTRVMFQLELVGLSRLGSNSLQVLKDNVPGYRMLRDNRSQTPTSDASQTAPYD